MYNNTVCPELQVNECFFRFFFTRNYNVGFGTPKTDMCSTCLLFKKKMKKADDVTKMQLLVQQRIHKLQANSFYEFIKQDSPEVETFRFDCQKNLALPKAPDQQAYFSMQLNFYQLAIINGASKGKINPISVRSYTWSELDYHKGSNEVASCVYHTLMNFEFSQRCGAQKKNSILIGMLSHWLLKLSPATIEQVEIFFPVVGHSYIPPDRRFGNIEKTIKRKPEITSPQQYIQVLQKWGSVYRLGVDTPVFHWKTSVQNAMKLPEEDAWREIAEILNVDVQELKKKVESLKGSFRGEKSRSTGKKSRRLEKKKTGDCSAKRRGIYISQTGKVMPKKTIIALGVLCKANCRLGCSSKFNEEDRELILRKYYSLDENAQTALLFNSVKVFPVKRHKVAARKHKRFSFGYSISFKQKTESICQDAICSRYQFSRKKIERIQNMLKQGKSAPAPSKRGKHSNRPHKIKEEVLACIINHIKKFAAEESHYSRNRNCHKKYLSPLLNMTQMHKLYLQECEEKKLDDSFKVNKHSMYVHVFTNKFNLSFGQPRSDTCSICDSGQNSETHTQNYKAAFNSQKRDREKPITEKNT
nr:unnamed protein product [Callosobruchus chinensis]